MLNAANGGLVQLVSRATSGQAGIFSGDNPADYDTAEPLRLWVIQVGIIIITCQLLAVALARLRQPRVIAEVIGGVVLGPSIMGQIPNFSDSIFPTDSKVNLTLTANVGLVFFLFLVGLEIDAKAMKGDAKRSAMISIMGLVIPLGLGAAVAIPLYHEFISDSVNKGYFILFVAVAFGITAFPVLCRILTETRLLDTNVGITVLGAGVGNDIIGWVLLALAVALANASTGLVALYVLLTGIGFVIFMLFPVRWAVHWLARKTGSLENGQPSTLMMTIVFLLTLTSAFFTDIIGIHPIFGGFLAGLIMPHEGGFAIALTEKLEDFVSLVFLPLYFALSGLSTDLSTLNTGKTWGYVVLICVVAFLSKFLACGLTAKFTGFSLREAGAIGSLMSCKGLVELIVLNVGLSAGILNTRTFSMFVFEAIVLTFMTTPLTLAWYPEEHRKYIRNISSDGSGHTKHAPGDMGSEEGTKTNFAVVLNRVEHLPAIMTLAQLLQRSSWSSSSADSRSSMDVKAGSAKAQEPPVNVNALRLVELSERTSALIRSQESASLAAGDALLSVVRTSGRMHRINVSSSLAVVPANEFAQRVSDFACDVGAQMVVIPWHLQNQAHSSAGAESQHQIASVLSPLPTGLTNPFEGFFPIGSAVGSGSVVYSTFVRKIFADSPSDVALFIDRASDSGDLGAHHIFLPFYGGPDDRLALDLLVQLCGNPLVRGTAVRITRSDDDPAGAAGASGSGAITTPPAVARTGTDTLSGHEKSGGAGLTNFTIASGAPGADTVYGAQTTTTRLQSETLDNLAWAKYAAPTADSPALSAYARAALRRIAFRELVTAAPLRGALAQAALVAGGAGAGAGAGSGAAGMGAGEETEEEGGNGGAGKAANVIVLVGRSRRLAREEHRAELKRVLVAGQGGQRDAGAAGGEMSRTVGDVGAAFLLSAEGRAAGSVLVVQAAQARTTAV